MIYLTYKLFFRFLGSNLRILPVHNTVNAINLMCTIAKVSHLRKMTPTVIQFKVLDIKMPNLWNNTDRYSASVPLREVAISVCKPEFSLSSPLYFQ